MRKVTLLVQEIIKIFAFFLFFFIWIRYFIRKFWISCLIASLCTFVLLAIMHLISKKRQSKIGLKLKEKQMAEEMFFSLVCENKPIDFFYRLTKKKHPNVTKHVHHITIDYPIEMAKTILWFDNSFSGLTAEKLIQIYNKTKAEKPTKIVVICKEITDKSVFSICLNFQEKFVLLDQYMTYQKLYKPYQTFPTITTKLCETKTMGFRDFVVYSFNKKRTKGYLFSAFVLVLSSLFVRETIYYCIVSSILLTFALISWLNPYFNKQEVDPI